MSKNKKLHKLATHLLAMKDDVYLQGHSEFVEICKEAESIIKPKNPRSQDNLIILSVIYGNSNDNLPVRVIGDLIKLAAKYDEENKDTDYGLVMWYDSLIQFYNDNKPDHWGKYPSDNSTLNETELISILTEEIRYLKNWKGRVISAISSQMNERIDCINKTINKIV